MGNILVLHGPNLNLLGTREPETYGKQTLTEIDQILFENQDNHNITCFQSNAEHELVEKIQQAKNTIDIILFNPAAFTHTSVALRDALLAVDIPFIEIHLSNTHQREEFRKDSYFSDIAVGTISGFGANSYLLALEAAKYWLGKI